MRMIATNVFATWFRTICLTVYRMCIPLPLEFQRFSVWNTESRPRCIAGAFQIPHLSSTSTSWHSVTPCSPPFCGTDTIMNTVNGTFINCTTKEVLQSIQSEDFVISLCYMWLWEGRRGFSNEHLANGTWTTTYSCKKAIFSFMRRDGGSQGVLCLFKAGLRTTKCWSTSKCKCLGSFAVCVTHVLIWSYSVYIGSDGRKKKYCFQCFVCYLPTIWADDEVAGKVFVLLNLGWQICDHSSPVKPSMQT